MIRKSLFLILALALLSVPVFLMAHAFTHFAQVDVLDVETESIDDTDLDEICFDCLALSVLNIIFPVSGLFLNDLAVRLRRTLLTTHHYSDSESFPYFSRAPPAFL